MHTSLQYVGTSLPVAVLNARDAASWPVMSCVTVPTALVGAAFSSVFNASTQLPPSMSGSPEQSSCDGLTSPPHQMATPQSCFAPLAVAASASRSDERGIIFCGAAPELRGWGRSAAGQALAGRRTGYGVRPGWLLSAVGAR